MGLNYDELTELLQYIEKNHSWKNMYENHCNNRDNPPKTIKYVRFHMDTRSCDIWSIQFDQVTNSKEVTKMFRTEMGYDMKEEIYKWLKGGKKSD